MIDYSYQSKAANQVLKNSLNSKFLASVLAACPSSGKTTISHLIINQYVQSNRSARIVVLTEGQNTLKIQYLEELKSPNVELNFTFGPFGSDAQVQVGLPQSIDKLNLKNIDLLIVDEAHNFYLAPTVQKIVKDLKPKHQILMTGSPTKYNAHNQDTFGRKFGMYYISAEELKKQGVFSTADLDVVRIENKKDPIQTIKGVLSHANKEKINTDKIMVACPNIRYARVVSTYLNGIGRTVSLSTSEDVRSDLEISRFKNGETDTLVVVNKGILGFNDKNMTALFDLKSSSNVDTSYQLFARILRIHPNNIKKSYIRVSDSDYNKQVIMLHKMMALMKTEIFKGFTGKNLTMEIAA